ncbi:2-keto-4-pentenoate hydratase [Lentzea sp. BCCO 10_0798]|uniref:2-keto-4-pentenoate hydratase n=1 Tax=Lentzea kristufekii TaxID=3095430 RepID=A0ABU4TN86_9PSEU|nr:2-keto-4-pentenoate hydratase [Lentzea sp. BCCO 10_0798]MDX8049695.1 2-keto-4-pentenoate hydratase [Lentzea sp. BCCO 10_0798]
MLTIQSREAAAELLRAAERDRVPIKPLVELYPEIDVVDAYEIQLLNVRHRNRDVIGHKVGLSSLAMQQMMGVDEPDYGHLLDDMQLAGTADASAYLYPRVEVEIAFLLARDLPGEGCTVEDVLDATEFVAPAIELIDSRIENWRIGLQDTIADNASSAGFMLGSERVRPSELDIGAVTATLRRNGELVAEGRGDAVLGDPAIAVAWLAAKVASFGVRLLAGDIVLPGSCTRAIDARPGDEFRAEFTGLGSVDLKFE